MRLLKIAGVLMVMLFLLPSIFTYVEPGHVGILIHRAGGGVDPKPMGPGLHFRNPLLSSIEEYPVFMQTLSLVQDRHVRRRRGHLGAEQLFQHPPSPQHGAGAVRERGGGQDACLAQHAAAVRVVSVTRRIWFPFTPSMPYSLASRSLTKV